MITMAVNTETINIDTVEKAVWDKMVEAGENFVEIPAVTSTDNGKLLGVSSGKWQKVDPPAAELPSVTAADNGDLLGVIEGAWGKVSAPSNIFVAMATLSQNESEKTVVTLNKTAAELYAAVAAGKLLKFSATVSEGVTIESCVACIAAKTDNDGTATYSFRYVDEDGAGYSGATFAGTDSVEFTEE